jgi:NTE family protein
MLRALHEAGIRPDLVVGTSAGALNAAAYATDPTAAGLDHLEGAWASVRRADVFPLRLRTLLPGLAGRDDHLVPAEPLGRWLQAHLGLERLEDTVIPLHVVATDLADGRPVVLSRGPALPALLASAAVPGLFAPVALDGRLLVDGGIAADCPVPEAVGAGATRVYVLPSFGPGATVPRHARPRDLARYAYSQVFAHWALDRAALPHGVRVEVLPFPVGPAPGPTDFSRAPEMIAAGLASTGRWLVDRDAPGPVGDTPPGPAWAGPPRAGRAGALR